MMMAITIIKHKKYIHTHAHTRSDSACYALLTGPAIVHVFMVMDAIHCDSQNARARAADLIRISIVF